MRLLKDDVFLSRVKGGSNKAQEVNTFGPGQPFDWQRSSSQAEQLPWRHHAHTANLQSAIMCSKKLQICCDQVSRLFPLGTIEESRTYDSRPSRRRTPFLTQQELICHTQLDHGAFGLANSVDPQVPSGHSLPSTIVMVLIGESVGSWLLLHVLVRRRARMVLVGLPIALKTSMMKHPVQLGNP